MTKKGTVQQLQAEINTDDELSKFLERDGVLVMDIYTDWCGPCIGMIGSLKKIKLELGGDDLHLAVCRADDIAALNRFRNKSEPTWLFASSGRVINIMFGTNVPKLMRVIAEELRLEKLRKSGEYQRVSWAFEELTPEEQERENVRKQGEEESLIIEVKAVRQKKTDYITFVTNQILTNMIDHGVMIFMPSVPIKDNLKRVMDCCDSLGLSCKEKRFLQIFPDQLEIINFGCDNPIDEKVWEKIFNIEIQVAIFKIADQETRSVETVFRDLSDAITESTTVMTTTESGEEVEVVCSPVVAPFDVVIEREIEEVEVDDGKDAEEDPEDDEKKEIKPKEKQFVTENVQIPGAWTPNNKETNAALIYLFFRHLTEHFLPPDPTPDPPHISMVFDAFKKNDIMEVYNKHKESMIAYGYFTSGDCKVAELLANTMDSYVKNKPTISDKLVLKVIKGRTEAYHALLALGPSYVSKNAVIGQEECAVFFPEGYTNLEEGEGVEEEVVEVSKKKKKKKKKKDEENSSVQNGQEVADVAALEEIIDETVEAEEKSATGDETEKVEEEAKPVEK